MARVLYSGVNEHGQPSEVMLGCAIGDIIPHFGTTAPPGTLVCDGSEVSREAYAELYQEIGALVGQGDGSTTFNLPDCRGIWVMGANTDSPVGMDISEGLPNITGSLSATNIITADTDGVTSTGALRAVTTGIGGTRDNKSTYQITNIILDASASSSLYGASDNVTPMSVTVNICIVYE